MAVKGVTITSRRPDYEKVVYKAVDQTRNSTTTLADDDDLVVPVVANGVYAVEGLIKFNAAATPDIKFKFSVPTSAELDGMLDVLQNPDGTINTDQYFTEATTLTAGSGGSDTVWWFRATLVVSSTAGSLSLQWAQNTSDAGDTTVKKGSWLKVRRLV